MMADKLPKEIRAKLDAFVGADREVVRVKLSTIEPKRLKFLWHPYLPLGKVVIVAGAPGHGKSQLTAYMAACVSSGTFYPSDVPTPGRALLMSAEDDLDDTVVPRLMAANAGGGNLRMVETVNVKQTLPGGVTSSGMIRIPGDLVSIIEWAREDPESARLVVFDPVVSFFDRAHSTYNNQDVRDAIDPLAAIAAEFGVTIVLVLHLNKSESREMAGRIAESHGFQAIARTVLAFGPDPDEEDEDDDEEATGPASKLLAITKTNLASARGATTMRFELEPAMVLDNDAEPVPTMRLVPAGLCRVPADDLLLSASERTVHRDAARWLADFVGDRWVESNAAKTASKAEGFSWPTIKRVRQSAGYRSRRHDNHWWIAANATKGTPGDQEEQDRNGSGGPIGIGGPLDPLTSKGLKGTPGTGGSGRSLPGSEGINGTQGDQGALNLADYRRHRDAILGEREDDE
jgi:hypothetical protein